MDSRKIDYPIRSGYKGSLTQPGWFKAEALAAQLATAHKAIEAVAEREACVVSALSSEFADLVAGEPSQPVKDSELLQASSFGQAEQVQKLLNCGADPRYGNSRALRVAAANGHYQVVKLLIEAGSDFRAMNNEALCNAAKSGYQDVVELLVENGAYSDLALGLAQAQKEQTSGVFGARRATPESGHLKSIEILSVASLR